MGDKDDNKRKLEEVALSPIFIRRQKTNPINLSDSEEYGDLFEYNSDSSNSNDEKIYPILDLSEQELITFDIKINTLEDLIELEKKYDKTKRYEFDMKRLHKMIPSMEKINNFIGMSSIKDHLVDHILFYLQSSNLNIDKNEKDIMHTVISGPPGVGKTEFAKALGELYLKMGILKNNKFIKVTRSDLVAKYLGQTAIKTKEMIKKCTGGVMFIDEVYSLGNKELRDSFSKEAIDTLNAFLSENRDKFCCILAGYEAEIKKCFFSVNPGLERRFQWIHRIEEYDPQDLTDILFHKIKEMEWFTTMTRKKCNKMIENNKELFKDLGGAIENLLSKTKLVHAQRVFNLDKKHRFILTHSDFQQAIDMLSKNKLQDDEEDQTTKEILSSLYV